MLEKGKVNILLDMFYGSSAKGQVVAAMADKFRPEILMANHSTSASHTIMEKTDGEDIDFVFKALPTASVLNKTREDYSPLIVLSPSSGFEVKQIIKEIKYCELKKEQVIIPARAVIVTQDHKEKEGGTNGTLHLGSTMSGQSYAFSEKMTRQPNTKLAKDYPELAEYATIVSDLDYFPELLYTSLEEGKTILAEMPQGFPLSIDFGPMFPYSTFRNISPAQFMADIGISTRYLGSVVANVRSLPIRVSNRFKNNSMDEVTLETDKGLKTPKELGLDYSDINAIAYGVNYLNDPKVLADHQITKINGMTGTSGPFEPDMDEISWRSLSEDLSAKAGKDTFVKEITTLTKLNRRICKIADGSISKNMLRKSLITLDPTHISVTFLNYLDPTVENATTFEEINSPIIEDWLSTLNKDISEVYQSDSDADTPKLLAVQAGKYLENVIFM